MKLTSYPKEKINILLLENISDNAVKEFKAAGYPNVKKIKEALSEKELAKEIKNIHLLGIRSKTQLSKNVLNKADKLLAAGCYCIGTNQVDLHTANQNGVVIFNAPYSNTRSVAELVIGLAIILLRKIPEKNNAAHAGTWMKDAAGSFELRGKILGLIGYGNIGSQVSILAEALGMQVIYYDVEPKLPLGNAKPVRTLKELLQSSNIISLHIPENTDTKNLIGTQEFNTIQNGCILINYSRGNVVDLDAMKIAIKNKKLGGAAIDVFPEEPEKNGSKFSTVLQNLPNVILTPHIGGSTEEAQMNISEDVTFKLLNYLDKGITTGSFTVPSISLPVQENTHRILHI
ncbi:MAG: phosphoglycerate dehydrogenase, partial [Fimbriimonadaceae bacterium]|nr:phosphoglycerate dehydrogenase [Chitinophagales bacterium]